MAASGGNVSSCVLLKSQGASDSVRDGEDVLLLTDAASSTISVFTQSRDDNRALSIQQISSLERLPLGLIVKGSGHVTLLFDAEGGEWSSWVLEDSLSGKQYPLNGTVEFKDVRNYVGRFYLKKSR